MIGEFYISFSDVKEGAEGKILSANENRMPPVDAIYRPHVVHHIHPPDMMAQQMKVKQKRYFSAED